jgi:excisionase family DNA binding protein
MGETTKPAKAVLFTAADVARFCACDLKTVHNWADAGKIDFFRTPGRHLRFKPAEVKRFLQRFGYPVPAEVEAAVPNAEVSAPAIATVEQPNEGSASA